MSNTGKTSLQDSSGSTRLDFLPGAGVPDSTSTMDATCPDAHGSIILTSAARRTLTAWPRSGEMISYTAPLLREPSRKPNSVLNLGDPPDRQLLNCQHQHCRCRRCLPHRTPAPVSSTWRSHFAPGVGLGDLQRFSAVMSNCKISSSPCLAVWLQPAHPGSSSRAATAMTEQSLRVSRSVPWRDGDWLAAGSMS